MELLPSYSEWNKMKSKREGLISNEATIYRVVCHLTMQDNEDIDTGPLVYWAFLAMKIVSALFFPQPYYNPSSGLMHLTFKG